MTRPSLSLVSRNKPKTLAQRHRRALGVRGKADAKRSICRVYSKPAFSPTRSRPCFSREAASQSDAASVGLNALPTTPKVRPIAPLTTLSCHKPKTKEQR